MLHSDLGILVDQGMGIPFRQGKERAERPDLKEKERIAGALGKNGTKDTENPRRLRVDASLRRGFRGSTALCSCSIVRISYTWIEGASMA